MSRNKFLAFLFLSICLLWPATADAQSSFKISREFAAKSIGHEKYLDMDLCGNLEITGGTGWLFIELTVSPYYHFYRRIHAGFRGKDVMDYVFVDCDPYYLPDIFLQYGGSKQEPSPAIEGQPIKYFFKAKLGIKGQDLKPFTMKICRGAMGYWYNSLKFYQLAQAVGIEAHWVPGDKEPENPIGAPQANADLTGTWVGYNAKGDDLGANQVTQDGKSITFVHPNGQITRGGYIVDATSIFVPVWGSTGIINASRTRIDFQGGSLNGIHLIRKKDHKRP